MRSWLFQGNPNQFRITEYLTDLDDILWSIRQRQFVDEIKIGDEVFIWRAAGKIKAISGVVAVGVVTDEPRIRADDRGGPYWIRPDSGNEYRAGIKLQARLLGKRQTVRAEWLMMDPILASHLIFRMRSQTNYTLTHTQAKRLRALCARTGADWTREESTAGLWLYQSLLGKSISKLPTSPVAEVATMIGRSVGGVYNKLMNFRSIDPRDERKGLPASSDTDKATWDEFYNADSAQIDDGRLDEEFRRIWRKEILEPDDIEEDYQSDKAPTRAEVEKRKVRRPGKVKPRSVVVSETKTPPRDRVIGEQALKNAGYRCEANEAHQTFLRKDGKQFMEKHHLIPMERYYEFERIIDHECNVVSLCPTCHRQIHLARLSDRKSILDILLLTRLKELNTYYSVTEEDVRGYYAT